MLSFSQNQLMPLSESSLTGDNLLSNVEWLSHAYYTNANISQQDGSLTINGTVDQPVPSGNKPSVFIETVNLNIDGETLPYFALKVKQSHDVALSVRFGISVEEWIKATANNDTLEQIRYAGVTDDARWIKWSDWPYGQVGSLEAVWGSDRWETVSANWRDYLQKALGSQISRLKGVQLIVGFADKVADFQVDISTLSFRSQTTFTSAPEQSGSSVFLIRSQELGRLLEENLFPERARVAFQIQSEEQTRFMALMMWKNNDGRTFIVRNGFLLQNVPSRQSLWIDFWNVINDVKTSIEPFSSLFETMKNGDVALILLKLQPDDQVKIDASVEQIDLFLSEPGLAVSLQSTVDAKTIFNDSSVYILTIGLAPLVLLSLAYVFRRNAEAKPWIWSIAIIAGGLIVRLLLVPFTAHQADVAQYCDVGALFYRQRSVFDMWVDFPLYYYMLVFVSMPYSLIRAAGFMDSSFLGIASYSWQMVTIKSVSILADVIAYRYLCKIVGNRRSRFADFAPEIYFFSPIVIMASATWAHLNSIFLALIILGFYNLKKERSLWSILCFALAAMTIPVGFAAVLAPILAALIFKKYKLAALSLIIVGVISLVLIAPMPSEARSSLIQRATVGHVANAPVFAPDPVKIAGKTVYPFMTSGYKFLRLLEFYKISAPSIIFNVLLAGGIVAATIWFIQRLRKRKSEDSNSKEISLEDLARYLIVFFSIFLLFYSTTNYIWNFWPVAGLIMLLAVKKRTLIAVSALVYSYVLLFGFDFIERISYLATGYSTQYFSQLGLQLDYWNMNLLFSLLFSILACYSIVLALFYGKNHSASGQSTDPA